MSCTDTLSLKAFGNLIGILQENYNINSLRIVVSYLNLVVYFPAENGQTHDKKAFKICCKNFNVCLTTKWILGIIGSK